jgi:maleate isomerase
MAHSLDINYGERARLGIIVPSGNFIAEPQIQAMLPDGVAACVTRLPLKGSGSDELLAMALQAGPAASMLADAGVQRVIFHCTAVSTYSVQLHNDIKATIEQASGLPCFSTADAIVRALETLKAENIVLLTPYIEAVNQREVAFLAHHGVEVVGQHGLGLNTNAEMGQISPEVLYDQAIAHSVSDADAYFISCTAVKSAEVIERLEYVLERPVITSNQAMVWNALRTCNIADNVTGFGRLFTH